MLASTEHLRKGEEDIVGEFVVESAGHRTQLSKSFTEGCQALRDLLTIGLSTFELQDSLGQWNTCTFEL